MVCGAIYNGLLDNNSKNFDLPGGGRCNMTAAHFVYIDILPSDKTLIDMVIAYNETSNLPLSGGMMDQPPIFLDAIQCFNSGVAFYKKSKKNISDKLKSLGA